MAVIERLYAEPKPQSPALTRIRRLSLPFEIIFALLAALAALLLIAVFVFALARGEMVRLSPEGAWLELDGPPWAANSIAISDLPLGAQAIGALALLVIQGALIGGLYCLHKLFGAYRRGVVFAAAPISWMRRAGMCLIAFALAPALFQPLVQAAGLLDRQWLHGHTIAALLVGGALFVLAHVIALGRDLEKEGEGYV